MDEYVVVSTKEDEVVDAGLASICPVSKVMGVAPVGGPVTVREHAVHVPCADPCSEGRSDEPVGPPYV
jgi:hypothetical protein